MLCRTLFVHIKLWYKKHLVHSRWLANLLIPVPRAYTCSPTIFWVQAWLRQKHYALQVWLDHGSNSWHPDHDSTFVVTETPALTTQTSLVSWVAPLLYYLTHWTLTCCLTILPLVGPILALRQYYLYHGTYTCPTTILPVSWDLHLLPYYVTCPTGSTLAPLLYYLSHETQRCSPTILLRVSKYPDTKPASDITTMNPYTDGDQGARMRVTVPRP